MEKIVKTVWVVKFVNADFPEGEYAAKRTRPGDRYERRGSWTSESRVSCALTFDTEAKARAGALSFLKSEAADSIGAKCFRLVKIEHVERHTESKDFFPKGTSIIDMVAGQDEEVA